jgi:hypothetical protein
MSAPGTSAGESTRSGPTEPHDTVHIDLQSGKILLAPTFDDDSCGLLVDMEEVLSLSSQETAVTLKPSEDS